MLGKPPRSIGLGCVAGLAPAPVRPTSPKCGSRAELLAAANRPFSRTPHPPRRPRATSGGARGRAQRPRLGRGLQRRTGRSRWRRSPTCARAGSRAGRERRQRLGDRRAQAPSRRPRGRCAGRRERATSASAVGNDGTGGIGGFVAAREAGEDRGRRHRHAGVGEHDPERRQLERLQPLADALHPAGAAREADRHVGAEAEQRLRAGQRRLPEPRQQAQRRRGVGGPAADAAGDRQRLREAQRRAAAARHAAAARRAAPGCRRRRRGPRANGPSRASVRSAAGLRLEPVADAREDHEAVEQVAAVRRGGR